MLRAARPAAALVLVLVTACGDNDPAPPDAGPSSPDASTAACTDLADPVPTGILTTVSDMPALTGCAAGGLVELAPDVWFVRSDPVSGFGYAYPRVGSSCADGLTVTNNDYTWSDGTIGFARRGVSGQGFEFARAAAVCLGQDGLLRYAERVCFQPAGEALECRDSVAGTGTRYPVLGEQGRNVTLVASDEFDAAAFDVDIRGDVAYVAVDGGVRAYDLSNPAAMPLLGVLDLPGSFTINDIEVVEFAGRRTAYVSDDATLVIDVTDPTAMVALGTVDNSGRDPYSHTVQVGLRGGVPHLYLGGQAGIPVYSLANPVSPLHVGTIALTQEGTHDMTVDGTRIYVNNEFGGFVTVDATSLTTPVEGARRNGTFYDHASAVGTSGARRLVIHGGEGLEEDGRGTHLRVFDGDPGSATFMQQLGEFATRAETGIHNMQLRDGVAYVAYYHDGFRMIDLTDPASPVELGHYNTWDRARGNGGAFDGAIGIDLAADGSVVLVNYGGSVMRLRPTPR
ncbi:MAG: hypothetical protein KA297_13275 [Kofleriaceae bacterium]|jgi:hypothetical protein|nr:hypothetical protein [Kofleriaceae bacterium]MBP6837068.1 hypothetical protein [Kofleriaceae bacterium]